MCVCICGVVIEEFHFKRTHSILKNYTQRKNNIGESLISHEHTFVLNICHIGGVFVL